MTTQFLQFSSPSESAETFYSYQVSRISLFVLETRSVLSCLVFFMPNYGDITLG